MKKENMLCIIVGCLLEKLGETELIIKDEEFKKVQNNKKYIGLSVERNTEDKSLLIKRTQKEDYTQEDLIDMMSKLIKELTK